MIQHDMNRLDSVSLLKTQWQTERGTKSISTIQATFIPNPFHCANTLQWSTETASKRQALCVITQQNVRFLGVTWQTNDGIRDLIGSYRWKHKWGRAGLSASSRSQPEEKLWDVLPMLAEQQGCLLGVQAMVRKQNHWGMQGSCPSPGNQRATG